MRAHKNKIREGVFYKLFWSGQDARVTDEEVRHFAEHPDEIDSYSAPVSLHVFFLFFGSVIGVLFVAVSKLIKFSDVHEFMSEAVHEFMIDIVFEAGVALIGASVTAYILGVLLNRQQSNARRWRSELRRRIESLSDNK